MKQYTLQLFNDYYHIFLGHVTNFMVELNRNLLLYTLLQLYHNHLLIMDHATIIHLVYNLYLLNT